MGRQFNIFIVVSFLVFGIFNLNAQLKKEKLRLGFAYGTGSQNKFPFDQKDYTHTVDFYKAQINYILKEKRKWSYELHIEPSINIAEHQLLNKFFIKPTDVENYEELRELFTQKRRITEYVLNFGFLLRYKFNNDFSTYAIASVGPMTSNKATERLAKGYAFSDVFGLGLSYNLGKVQVDFRASVRHTSNLELKQPNTGHNTTNMEFGVLFPLQ